MKKTTTYVAMGVAIFAFTFILLMLCPWFIIQNIEIDGIKTLTKPEIISTLNLDKTTNLFAFNSFSAKSKMKENNYVDKIKIKKVLPATLKIEILEKEVYGYIPYISSYIYIGKDGEVIDVQTSYTDKLPIITGLNFDHFSVGKRLEVDDDKKFDVVVNFTNIFHSKEMLKDIIKIDISDVNNINLYIGNIQVLMGDYSNLNIKINTLIEVLKNININEKGFLYLDDIEKDPVFRYIT